MPVSTNVRTDRKSRRLEDGGYKVTIKKKKEIRKKTHVRWGGGTDRGRSERGL